jgi:hypothetical protein
MADGAFAQNRQGPWGPGMMGWGYGPGMMGSGYGPGMMGYGGPWAWGRETDQGFCSAMLGQIDGRLAYIKAELKITSDQETLWNSYAAAARDSANAMLARCTSVASRRSGASVSLPDRLDQDEQSMTAQLEALRSMNKTLKPLYAALSDTQKQTADQLFWGPMGMM